MKTTTKQTTTTEIITDAKTAFAIPGQDSIIDVVRSDGTSWHYHETLEQVRLRYPGAELVNCEDFFAEKAARQDTPITWTETTKEQYWEMLEVLPPAAMGNGGFLVGEPWDHHAKTGQPRFAGYRETRAGKYYTANRPMTRKEFAAEMLKSPVQVKEAA